MRIFSRSTLAEFWELHPDAEQSLRAWFHEVEQASWKSPAEVRARYGSADFVKDRIVFDIRGNHYRLVAAVRYAPLFLVSIRFVGTHAAYDRIDVATV